MEQWITQELERTELGDSRRTKRLIKIVENLSAKPEASVPQASGTWAETKATYDFWGCLAFIVADLLSSLFW